MKLDSVIAVVDAARMLQEFENGRRLVRPEIEEDDLENLLIQQIELCSLLLLNKTDLVTEEELRARVNETFSNPECGNVIRVKGFVRTGQDTLMQINATAKEMQIEPTVFAREVLIVTGEGLHREAIDAIWAEASEIITPGNSTAGL